MINKTAKYTKRIRRTERVRYQLRQNSGRPRLVFHKSNRYVSAQIIDDTKGITIAQATSISKDFPSHKDSKKSKSAAAVLGKLIAEKATKLGIKQVVLDRSGMVYHGRIAAFAEAAREAGLDF